MAWRKRNIRKRGARKGRRGGRSKYLRGGSGLVKATKSLVFPDRIMVKLPYFENFSLSNAANPNGQANWNLNSIYDPNAALGGHQAAGVNQWSQFYNRYRVLGVKMRLTYHTSPEGGAPAVVWASVTNGTNVTGGSFEQLEQSHQVIRNINPAGQPTTTIIKYYNMPRITGRTLAQYMSDDRYQAVLGSANPAEVITLVTGVRSILPGAITAPTVYGQLHLTFFCELFDRKNVLLSALPPGGDIVQDIDAPDQSLPVSGL
jgi:hypothetical protein